MVAYKYIVTDDNNTPAIYDEFESQVDAIDYAKTISPKKYKGVYVLKVEVELNDFREVTNTYSTKVIYKADDESESIIEDVGVPQSQGENDEVDNSLNSDLFDEIECTWCGKTFNKKDGERVAGLGWMCQDCIDFLQEQNNTLEIDHEICNDFEIKGSKIVKYLGHAKDAVIPEGIKYIGEAAFDGCESLTSIVIPNSVTSIEDLAFYECRSLTSIVIPNSVTSIGDYAFSECGSLTSITFEERSQLKSIGIQAFKDCSSLTSIVIPNSVTSIGFEAFDYCSSLTSIVIPNSVTKIGNDAFEYCTLLTSVTFEEGSKLTSVGTCAFYDCESLTSIQIPSSVTGIGDDTFKYCSSLTSVTFEEGSKLTSIGDYAFSNCSSLTSITIPNGVTSIGVDAFQGCRSLQYNEYGNCLYLGNEDNPYLVLVEAKDKSITEATILNNTRFIMNSAFRNCNFLTVIIIPNSVTNIENDAFRGCRSLIIYCEASSQPSGWKSYWNSDNCKVIWGYKGGNNNMKIEENTLKTMVEDLNDADEDEIECAWCGEIFSKSDCKKETDFGWLCPRCIYALKSRGEELCFTNANDNESSIASNETLAEPISEETHAQFAKPEGDRVKAYNNALKYAKQYNVPFIYGYTSIKHNGKFFALDNPIKCSRGVEAAAEEFRKKYIGSGTIYTAYPDRELVTEEMTEELEWAVTNVGFDGNTLVETDESISGDCIVYGELSEGNATEETVDIAEFVYNKSTEQATITGLSSDFTSDDTIEIEEILKDNIETNLLVKKQSSLLEAKADQEKLIQFAGEELANKFFKYKDRLKGEEKDLYYWLKKDVKDLEIRISEIESTKSNTQAKKEINQEGAEYLGSDGGYDVYYITTYEASRNYGRGTKWCISMKDYRGFWDKYIKRGIKFYFFIGENSRDKYALALYPKVLSSKKPIKDEKGNNYYNITRVNYELYNSEDALSYSDIGKLPLNLLPVKIISDLEKLNGFGELNQKVYINSENVLVAVDPTFTGDLIMPSNITSIRDKAFYDCSSLTSIVIPNSVTSIGYCAFFDCSSLTSVTFDKGSKLESIGDYAFYECSSLTSIRIPSSVTSIGKNAFSRCKLLTAIVIPNSVTSIEENTFYECKSLTSIVIPNSVTSIGQWAFWGCRSLTSIVIPNSVTSIENCAFQGCSSLQYNEYGNCLYIGNENNPYLVLVKAKNESITNATIHENTRFIMNHAFFGCESLTSIVIPNSVISIGEYAFNRCSFLTIYCRVESKPNRWDSSWNFEKRPVMWGVKNKILK